MKQQLIQDGKVYTAAHWGCLEVNLKGGKILFSDNAFKGLMENSLQSSVADLIDGKRTNRIKAPMVRKSYLEKKPNNNELRGRDEWVEVSYEQAIKLVSDEVKRIRAEKGSSGIYGGSYGWKSSGNLHNCRSLLHRFLNLGGGFVGCLGDYSAGAAQVVLPYVIGSIGVYDYQTSWPLVLEHSEVVVIWGANPINTLKIAWTATDNQGLEYFKKLKQSHKKIICIDPIKSSTIRYFGENVKWIAPYPNTDVAMMLGIAHTMLVSGKYNQDFIENYTEGFDKFAEYVLGKTDGIPKTAKWAEQISGVKESQIKELAKLFFENRTMIMAGWSIQRQHHGEQAHWMLVTLASMIGQIGLPGGGFGFSYHHGNGGSPIANSPLLGMIQTGAKRGSLNIPVARIADCLLNSGKKLQYNGREIVYPEIEMIYWVGGNPFAHHQDTNLLIKAWRKPKTIVVNEMYWTPTAKMADIVFPITTPYERNDLTMSGSYSNLHIYPMKQVVAPMPKAKSDYQVFLDLSTACGFGNEFSEGGKSEMQWLEEFYNQAYKQATNAGILMADGNEMLDFATFWKNNKPLTFVPSQDSKNYIAYSKFREDPILNPLRTSSGKIEIYSQTIAKMNYKDCKGHPMWFEPIEWLGMKDKPAEFALISPHPSFRLHSQLGNTSLRDSYAVADREPIWINPTDAKKKGIKNGDLVRVFNKRGCILAGAVVCEFISQGVVKIDEGAWCDFDFEEVGALCKNGNVNVLTMDLVSSELSCGNIANTALVDIEKYQGKAPKLTAFMPPNGAK